jgi:hypothetical protein
MPSSVEKFILDSSALIAKFPEPKNMKVVNNATDCLHISEKHTNPDDNECCDLEIGLADIALIELRNFSLCANHKGKGYETSVITELILQCRKNNVNLFSDFCYEHEIDAIRSTVKELGLYEQCYSEDEEGRDEDEAPNGKCWSFRLMFGRVLDL